MNAAKPDKRVLMCNYVVGTSACSVGAVCYPLLLPEHSSGASSRMLILARSRGGRWIRKKERLDKLTNFRLKTIPPEHPLYADLDNAGESQPEHLQTIQAEEITQALRQVLIG